MSTDTSVVTTYIASAAITDREGRTPLLLAALGGAEPDYLLLLADNGADVNAQARAMHIHTLEGMSYAGLFTTGQERSVHLQCDQHFLVHGLLTLDAEQGMRG